MPRTLNAAAAVRTDRRRNRRGNHGDDTRARIIDAAEAMFADHGYDGTSLRGIMAKADVSISLINYHFGNKEGLLRAIFECKAAPLNRQRLALIEEAVAAHPVPRLEDLLRAYFLPSFKDGLPRKNRRNNFMRLVGRIGSDQNQTVSAMMTEYFDDFQRRFITALSKTLPNMSEEELYWRLHCLLCIITHTLNNPDRIYLLSDGRCDLRKVDDAFEHLLTFLVGGMTAPPPSLDSRSGVVFGASSHADAAKKERKPASLPARKTRRHNSLR